MSRVTHISFKKYSFVIACIISALAASHTSSYSENTLTTEKKVENNADEDKVVSTNKPEETTKIIRKEDNEKEKLVYMVFSNGPTAVEKGFKDYLAEQGTKLKYIERDCKGNHKTCNQFVQEIKQAKPDLIYTCGTLATLAIAGTIEDRNQEKYIWDIPIVSAIVTDPIYSKIIYDLKKPGRNLTGVNHIPTYEAQVNAMLSYLPVKKIGIFHVSDEAVSAVQIAGISKACAEKGIEAIKFPFEYMTAGKLDESRLDEAFAKIKAARVELVYLPSSMLLDMQSNVICESAKRNKLLTFVVSEGMLNNKEEPLMGLIAHRPNIGRALAVKADQILNQNIDPKNIPYERFEKISLFIMKKVMLELGVFPPLLTIKRVGFAEVNEKKEEKK